MKKSLKFSEAKSILPETQYLKVAIQTHNCYYYEMWDRQQVIQTLKNAESIKVDTGIERLNGLAIIVTPRYNVYSYEHLFIEHANSELLILEKTKAREKI